MCSHTDRIALIPAYQPDEKLPALARETESKGFSVIVVDDGSGPAYTELFEETQLYATVLTHPFNQGKGCALKTGYLYLIFTGFCLLFGITYEHFSYDVTSSYMTRAFSISTERPIKRLRCT